jgi:hypothetical protein
MAKPSILPLSLCAQLERNASERIGGGQWPRPRGVSGDGAEIGAVHCLGGQRVPDCIMVTASTK